jgi:hypothetical protein
MKKAIHHVMLNERLDECFGILDDIQRTYRTYNAEYCKITQAYPKVMDDFYKSFEADICKLFKMWPEAERAEVVRILTEETQKKQEELEAVELAKWKEKQAEEERLREEQAKATGKPPPKAPAKKGPAKEEKP